jgi:UV DNA damage endonuclease
MANHGILLLKSAPIIIHGGKRDCSTKLIDSIHKLPSNIANRLVLENDEYSYSVDSLLALQQFIKIPIVFDAHHHLIYNKLEDYDNINHLIALEACRATWPDATAQVVHISNGRESLYDRSHSDFITKVPSCFLSDRGLWIEVEAKAKERAIMSLRLQYPNILS